MKKVALLKGGISVEREGSLEMGSACAKALRSAGYEVVEVDAGHDLDIQLREIGPDVVFNALMGRWGEDGSVQGLLEWLRIPYTHSGVCASAVGMNKVASRMAYRENGLPVAKGRLVHRDELDRGHPIEPPYVLKPVSEGSSVGIHFILDERAQVPADKSKMPEWLLAESYVEGRELTVGVVADRALSVTQIETDSGYYDYNEKYFGKNVKRFTPAPLPDRLYRKCMNLAEGAHKAIGCRYISRTDIRWNEKDGEDGFVILETNTQPAIGFPHWSLDQQLAIEGHTLADLCHWLVEDASINR
jgi:D-alanine-D-alanine ligase